MTHIEALRAAESERNTDDFTLVREQTKVWLYAAPLWLALYEAARSLNEHLGEQTGRVDAELAAALAPFTEEVPE